MVFSGYAALQPRWAMAWGKRRGALSWDPSRGFLPAFSGCTKAAVKAAPGGWHVSHVPERHMSDGCSISLDRQGDASPGSCLLGGARSLPPAPRSGVDSAGPILRLASQMGMNARTEGSPRRNVLHMHSGLEASVEWQGGCLVRTERAPSSQYEHHGGAESQQRGARRAGCGKWGRNKR